MPNAAMPTYFALFFLATLAMVVFVFALVIRAAVRQSRLKAAERRANEALPAVTNPVTVTSRRTEVSGNGEGPTRSHYYATFEFASGARQEFTVTGEQYAQLAERDRGLLTSQGTWFHSFQRDRMIQDR